ncbi:hypothetical protein P4282_22685 [Bacillus swezeyi]|uniref:hypothetical protein n=1 Tax=Bacillus swezeyi TaxID=1925020 RepID=UPI002E1F736D|nr:hypothetical protein [Bacillus swezeyi]
MELYKGSAGISLIIFGLLLGANTHQQVSAGEAIFCFLGGPVRSSAGLHYISVMGLVLMITGFVLASLYYRKVAWIRLKLLLFIIGFTALYPLVTEELMFFLKWNARGADALEYITRESSCGYSDDQEEGKMDCTVKVNNYGKNAQLVSLSPEMIHEFEFKAETLTAPPHSQRTYEITFTAPGNESVSMTGFLEEPEFEIEVVQ